MINVSIAGIGGQGSVLAAKILAQAAQAKGWQVRTAETIGMAQRGGNVISHVRMGNLGEAVYAPLPAQASVDVVIALEPGEGVRALNLLKPEGLLVMPSTGIAPTVVDFKAPIYNPDRMIYELKEKGVNLVVVNDEAICSQLMSRKPLNVVMLAYALLAVERKSSCATNALHGNLGLAEMREAIPVCVKEQFVSMNMKALNIVEKMYQS